MSHTPEHVMEFRQDDVDSVAWRYEYGINGPFTVRLVVRVEMDNGDVLAIGGETLPHAPFTRVLVSGLGKGHGKGF